MYNYQEDIKKSLNEISEKLNVEPKNRPAAYNIHEEIANTLHDISEKVSEGGGSGQFVIHVVPDHEDVFRFDKTWQEIYDAFVAGASCVVDWPNTSAVSFDKQLFPVVRVWAQSGADSYRVDFISISGAELNLTEFYCESADGYPYYD